MSRRGIGEAGNGLERPAVLEVTVIPRSPRAGVGGFRNGRLVVRVTAAREKGKANEACIEEVASFLGVPKTRISIVAGASSRRKTLAISGMSAGELDSRVHRPARESI